MAPENPEGVVWAVNEARATGMPLAVVSTGHGIKPLGDLSDSFLIDTSKLDSVEIDPAHRIARIGGGVTWSRLLEAAGRFGLTAPFGTAGSVGVAGYCLGGADIEDLGHLDPGHRNVGGTAVLVTGGQGHFGSGDQFDHTAGKVPDPELRSRQVTEDADFAARLLGGGADVVDGLGVTGFVGVGEVETEYVHPGLDHLHQRAGFPAGGPDGCNYLRFSDCGIAHNIIVTRRARRPVSDL